MRSNPFVDKARTLYRVIAVETTGRTDEPVDMALRRLLDSTFEDARMWPAVGPSKPSNVRSGRTTVRVDWDAEKPSEEPCWPLGELDAEVDPQEVV